ncbi:methionyl-tRNA formyltransferase [Mesorhizobium sp. SB112]|uniref:methionyl-tRNA formyltransferase n=1 Tax=Mesorhizobium sp. SB112 TaxID=3151853 RepID=UPI0032670994
MARIANFLPGKLNRVQLHDEIDATFYAHEYDGRRILQINTAGRPDREVPGKVSQSIQLDEKSGRQLFEILQTHFAFK